MMFLVRHNIAMANIMEVIINTRDLKVFYSMAFQLQQIKK